MNHEHGEDISIKSTLTCFCAVLHPHH